MTEARERVCVGCGDSEEQARLESCPICNRAFCPDCAHRAFSRRFCGPECARAYWFAGESDDDDQDHADD
jgi:hypothetical protein